MSPRSSFQPGSAPYVVLGSSTTALAVARRVRDLGGRAIHVDTEEDAGDVATRSRLWSERHRAPRSAEALQLLLELGDKHDGKHDGKTRPPLVATGDLDLWFVVEHRAALQSRFDVLHPENDALVTCLDKVRFHRFCDANGLPVPRWFLCGATGEEVRRSVAHEALPLVARAASASRHRGAFPKMVRVDTPADIDALAELVDRELHPDGHLLLAESLLGRDLVRYSVAFCRSRSASVTFEAIKQRPAAATGEVGTFVTLAEAPEARAVTLRAAEALDYYGIGEMEVFWDRSADRYYAIELNARPWLQFEMERLAGVDFLGFLAGRSEGTNGVARGDGAWIDVLGDLFWRFSRTARAASTEADPGYLRSLTRARAFKTFALHDPGPALFELSRWVRRRVRRGP